MAKKHDTKKHDAARVQEKADELSRDAVEARNEANLADANRDKSAEQRKADEAFRKADDARAQAQEASAAEARDASAEPLVAEAARRMIPADRASMEVGDHLAQKFGNDPANPKLALHLDPDDKSVRLSRITPDRPEGPEYTTVHPEMVGDYLRAGWTRADAI